MSPNFSSLLLALQETATGAAPEGGSSSLSHLQFGNLLGTGPDQYRVLGWIVLLPLLGAIINGVFGKRLDRQAAYIAGVGSVAASFLLSVFAFFALVKMGGGAHEGAEGAEHVVAHLSYNAGDWFHGPAGGGSGLIRFRYVLDALSAIMLMVVNGVGLLIHIYSTGYMSHDKGYAKFFAFLNLFMFSMLNLILADSIVLLFVGWEGVGLCSYLLIGFWYTNTQYAQAAQKAFIVNRIGDVGMLLGMTILAWKAGSYNFADLRAALSIEDGVAMHELSSAVDLNDFLASTLSFGSTGLHDAIYRIIPSFTWGGLACLLLFIGCTGKSAQIPLYVWLPDAMAGPTPVSALIHAATMVTAGVYLLNRLSFLFVSFPTVLAIIAVIGATTALFAATIAITQNELKKVLAYSTVSQLGYMFIGCGVGAFGAGLFHVYTHAMFKACLFLGAGAVMHACRDKQDLRELGGLRKYLPWTFGTFLIATLAIIGTPGLSGFFSKDEILFRALASHNPAHPWVGNYAYWVGLLTALLTAFYMCRLLFLTFWGDFKGWSLEPGKDAPSPYAHKPGPEHKPIEREPELSNVEGDEAQIHAVHLDKHGHSLAHADDHGHGHDDHGHGHGNPWDPPKDNPWNMTAPLVILAFMSIVAGWIGLPYVWIHHEGPFSRWLEPVVTEWPVDHTRTAGLEVFGMVAGTAAFLLGSGLAYYVYVMAKGEPAKRLAAQVKPLYQLVYDKWRIDEVYDALIVRPLRGLSTFAAEFFDRWIIDGLVNLVGMIPRGIGFALRKAQNGIIQTYGAVFAVGLLAALGWVVFTPAATIAYRADGNRLSLQAYGGPGYSYAWDLQGDGHFSDLTDQTQQNTTCNPTDLPDGRRVCRVGLRVRNAFGRTHDVVRTIEIPTEIQERQ